MIYSERLSVFLHAQDPPDSFGGSGFGQLRKEAAEQGVPIIRQEMESFLEVLLELNAPKQILEVGTASGYSAMRMASCTPDTVRITTIEQDEERLQMARVHFDASPWGDRITLIGSDAAIALPELETGRYDFVFMDAAKAQYIRYLPQVLRVLRTGGLLVSDNVLQDGAVLESRFAIGHRDRTIHRRMRAYLHALKRTDGLVTSIVPIGDGAAVTVKKKDRVEICTDREGFPNC